MSLSSKNSRNGNSFDVEGLRFFGGVVVILLMVAVSVQIVYPTVKSIAQHIHFENTAGVALSSGAEPPTDTSINQSPPKESDIPKISDDTLRYVPAPEVSARSYLVADLTTDTILLSKNSSTKRPVASITKLMTALVADEQIGYNTVIPITKEAVATHGRQGRLEAGQRMQLSTLIYPLLLESSNDAAAALAITRGRSAFISLMNQKAATLNMHNTAFADASGLSSRNISTAEDLLKLASHIYNEKKYIFDITTQIQKTFEAPGSDTLLNYTNNNPFKATPYFVGGKNGYTSAARKTLLSLFALPTQTSERILAIIVLGSENHAKDTEKLLDWFITAVNSPE